MRDRFFPLSPPDFIACKASFSFYRYIDGHVADQGGERTLHRIFSLMRKMGVLCVAEEELARMGELETEVAAVEKRCRESVDLKAWRFSFFKCPVHSKLLSYVRDSDFLGYAVLLDLGLPDGTHTTYVYESIVAQPAFKKGTEQICGEALPNHYIHCVRLYSCWVAENRFTIYGSFFSQQNGLTHVCAHAALRWLLNNLPERAEAILSYEDINRNLGIDHTSRKVGQYADDVSAAGLSIQDLIRVIKAYNYRYILADFEAAGGRRQPYWRFVYSMLESGYPVLIFFTAENARHVICAIGHSLNSDIWDAEAHLAYAGAPPSQYLSTSSWVDHFVIHDDNYGMYFCMPIKALSPPTTSGGPFEVTGALGIVPTEVGLDPLPAEFYASFILGIILQEDDLPNPCYWLGRLKREFFYQGRYVVLRTLLVSRAGYEKHVGEMEDAAGNFLLRYEKALLFQQLRNNNHFWMTEVSLTDLYTANKHKLGEVLFAPTKPEIKRGELSPPEFYSRVAFKHCMAMRLPGNIICPELTHEGNLEASFGKTEVTEHVPLLRTCAREPKLEW